MDFGFHVNFFLLLLIILLPFTLAKSDMHKNQICLLNVVGKWLCKKVYG